MSSSFDSVFLLRHQFGEAHEHSLSCLAKVMKSVDLFVPGNGQASSRSDPLDFLSGFVVLSVPEISRG